MDEPEIKINSDNILDTEQILETSHAIEVEAPESKIETQNENICESILSNNVSNVESKIVSYMDEPEIEINSVNILDTVTTIETSKVIEVEEPESKTKTQIENI